MGGPAPAGAAELVAAHPDLEMLESGKCRCKLTGHEMAPNKDVVEVCALPADPCSLAARAQVQQWVRRARLPARPRRTHSRRHRADPRAGAALCRRT